MQKRWGVQAGFTIIELLIVLLIITLLTTLAATSYVAAQKRSRDSVRKSDVNLIAGAVESYYSQNQQFPGDAISTTVAYTAPSLSGEQGSCEGVTDFTTTSSSSPFYFYSPSSTCGTSTAAATETSGTTLGYNPAAFTKGGWLPSLSTYLNPQPIDPRFLDSKGNSTPTTVIDYMDSTTSGSQASNDLRTFVYRNLSTGYAVYARLEDTQDTDFTNDFKTSSGGLCDTTATLLPSNLDCVPSGSNSNPIVVYMVQK